MWLQLLSVLGGPDDGGSTRGLVLAQIERDPGLPLDELRTRLSLGWGVVYHHVERLEREGRIRLVTAGRRRLALPAEHSDPGLAVARARLRGDMARRVAEAFVAAPERPVPELAAAVGASKRLVYYHMRQLADAGLVAQDRRGARVPTPLLVAALKAERAERPMH